MTYRTVNDCLPRRAALDWKRKALLLDPKLTLEIERGQYVVRDSVGGLPLATLPLHGDENLAWSTAHQELVRRAGIVSVIAQYIALPATMHTRIVERATKADMSMQMWIINQLAARLDQLDAQDADCIYTAEKPNAPR